MRNGFEIFIPIVFFISLAVILYHKIKSRHTERLAIIEKGLTEEQLDYFKKGKGTNIADEWPIKIGVILIGVGTAILAGSMFPYDMRDEIILGLIFLLPGIGLILAYKYLEKKSASEKKEQ